MGNIRRLVLDVLKPHAPILTELVDLIVSKPGVDSVNATLIEVDANTESIKLIIQGNNLDFETINDSLKEVGAVVHSIDQVVAGKTIIEEVVIHD